MIGQGKEDLGTGWLGIGNGGDVIVAVGGERSLLRGIKGGVGRRLVPVGVQGRGRDEAILNGLREGGRSGDHGVVWTKGKLSVSGCCGYKKRLLLDCERRKVIRLRVRFRKSSV